MSGAALPLDLRNFGHEVGHAILSYDSGSREES